MKKTGFFHPPQVAVTSGNGYLLEFGRTSMAGGGTDSGDLLAWWHDGRLPLNKALSVPSGLNPYWDSISVFKEEEMADRRPLNPNVTVPKPGGGEQPRSRNKDGQVREKRDDAGKPRKK